MKKLLVALRAGAAVCCGADTDDDCDATRFAYSCFGGDFLVTACAQCGPAPNTPGALSRAPCSLRWANASCVASIEGHRWTGSSTRLDCAVDGGTGQAVHYNFDLGTQPAVAYMSISKDGKPATPVMGSCDETTAN